MIRFLDILFSIFGLVCLFPLLLLIYLVGFLDTRSPLFIQKRLGKNKTEFYLIKFRTMNVGTRSVGSHLVNPDAVTKLGAFLRKTKLDELPQLVNVLIGDMSIVGPRPNLATQFELINYRDQLGIYNVRPGITGLAQIKGVDMSKPQTLAEIDHELIKTLSVSKYFKYIAMTVLGQGQGDRVRK